MDQRDLKSGMDERGAPDNEVTALLGSLPRVAAPGNFEFGVRAKIAERRSTDARSSLLRHLKIAAPPALLLVVTGLVFFYDVSPPQELPSIVESAERPRFPVQEPPPAESTRETVSTDLDPSMSQPVRTETRAASRRYTGRERTSGRAFSGRDDQTRIDDGTGGYIDRTVRPANVIMAPGFEAMNPNRSANANIAGGVGEPVRNVLGILGVDVEFAAGEYKVSSVAEKSIGARAGVKAGDVIETIDGRAVHQETKLRGEGPKNFVVRRGGKRVNLKVGN